MPRTSLRRSLTAIERAFTQLEATLKRLDKRVRQADRRSRVSGIARGPRRPAVLTPKRRAQLKLQGAYMGYIRQLKPTQKARVKAVKAKRGFEAAIRMARRLAVR
jgi:hypothetical protein